MFLKNVRKNITFQVEYVYLITIIMFSMLTCFLNFIFQSLKPVKGKEFLCLLFSLVPREIFFLQNVVYGLYHMCFMSQKPEIRPLGFLAPKLSITPKVR